MSTPACTPARSISLEWDYCMHARIPRNICCSEPARSYLEDSEVTGLLVIWTEAAQELEGPSGCSADGDPGPGHLVLGIIDVHPHDEGLKPVVVQHLWALQHHIGCQVSVVWTTSQHQPCTEAAERLNIHKQNYSEKVTCPDLFLAILP